MSSHLLKLLVVTALAAGAGCASSDYAQNTPPTGEVKSYRTLGGSFDGTVVAGAPSGVGELVFDDGRRYTGAFADGVMRGEGKMSYPDGRVVTGEFRSDAEVSGKITFPDGRVFDGRSVGGIPDGKGMMRFPDGVIVTGTFESGRASGDALEMRPDGRRFFGPFDNGVAAGMGFCSANGKSSICNRKGSADNTTEALRERAEQRVVQKLKEDAIAAQAAVDRTFKERLAKKEAERAKLQDKRGIWSQDTDRPDLAQGLAALDKQIAKAQKEIDAEAAEQARRNRAIDVGLAKRLANKTSMARLRDAEIAKEKSESQKRLLAQEDQCRQRPLRLTDCACLTIMKTKDAPKPTGACES